MSRAPARGFDPAAQRDDRVSSLPWPRRCHGRDHLANGTGNVRLRPDWGSIDMARMGCARRPQQPGSIRSRLLAALAALWAFASTTQGLAQCFPVAGAEPRLIPAAFQDAALAAGSVQLTFLGHSSFLIESAGGATVVTDFNGFVLPPQTPDIVTMNNAHSTHYTDYVDPAVEHVLRGWDPKGGVALHDVTHLDLHVRNIPTNVRDFGGVRTNGNSIFVFEVADMCIAHLGHLHHVLSEVHLAELGMIDVLLVPVDGSFTMAQELMVEVIGQILPAVIIPMHYFGPSTLNRFISLIGDRYEVEVAEVPTVVLSRPTLPYRKVLVLPGS
jgi:L-ascorbate metabolism protein UlaG (beta-lactamase superfamily)